MEKKGKEIKKNIPRQFLESRLDTLMIILKTETEFLVVLTRIIQELHILIHKNVKGPKKPSKNGKGHTNGQKS